MQRIEELTSSNEVFIFHSYLQHDSEKWWEKYCLRYGVYLILEQGEQKDANAFAHRHGLTIDPKDDAKIGGEHCAAVVERDMTDDRSKDHRHMQAGVISDDDGRKAIYMLHFLGKPFHT